MAYARWSADCAVYVYEHVDGGYICEDHTPSPISAKKMLDHLTTHFVTGEKVPFQLLGQFGVLAAGLPVMHVDPVIARMVARIRADRHNDGKISSYDTDVPADLRLDPRKLVKFLEKEVKKVDDDK